MFNSETFIAKTINSIINQTYQNWELILIDDYSTDKTLQIAQDFIVNSKIKLVKNKTNQGVAISRNKGIEFAKGDFIAFLDADDLWKPEKLSKQIAFMKAKNCDVCFSSYDLINEKGSVLNKQIRALPVLSYKKLLKSNYIGNLTGIYSAEKLGKITTSNLRKRQDWLLWLAAIKKSGKPAKSIQESLAYYRVRDNSISSKKMSLLKYNYAVYKRGLGFSAIKSLYSMVVFLKEHFFVKAKQKITLQEK
jgi:glycosyltransferase involved in cell wall biosynthesis